MGNLVTPKNKGNVGLCMEDGKLASGYPGWKATHKRISLTFGTHLFSWWFKTCHDFHSYMGKLFILVQIGEPFSVAFELLTSC